ncbi:hypothetical protein EDD15DRAFT_2364662 [Pisolithus albus]|nr:hypothetical protein EDD15DRAFT_2364662 [Pisolithus albus]
METNAVWSGAVDEEDYREMGKRGYPLVHVHAMEAVEADIHKLPIKHILAHIAGMRLTIPKGDRSKKEKLVQHVLAQASPDVIEALRGAGTRYQQEKNGGGGTERTRKRKRDDDTEQSNNVGCVEEQGGARGHAYNLTEFLELPSSDEVKECYRKFYDATATSALAMATCAVCARECSVQGDGIQSMKVTDIPNAHRLHPRKGHPRHTLVNGMLLEPSAVYDSAGVQSVTICTQCSFDLRNKGHHPPRFSLANQLWIGEQPWVLKQLTFPEQLLIAHLYPRVYVFKLFPKRSRGIRDISSMQNAMRGNVSTYDHNMDAIIDMVDGNLMPRPPTILASLISITFIGVGRLPSEWMRSMFRVRRQAVKDALLWLQKNNPKYYGRTQMSSERLENLPVDDVPFEISGVVRQSDDTGIIDEESNGYVPQDDDEVMVTREDTGEAEQIVRESGEGPGVVPLQVSGTIDTV